MFFRTLSLGAVVAGLLVLPLACSSFSGTSDPGGDGGGSPDEGGSGTDGGPSMEASSSDGPTATEGSVKDTVMVLASGYSQLRAIAANETDVVFIDQGGAGVLTVPILGGSVVTLSPGGGPSSVAVANSRVFWTDVNDGTVASIAINGVGGVMRTASSGTGADKLASVIAASPTTVFAMSANNGLATDEIRQYDLSLAPIANSTLSNLQNPFAIASYGSKFYWTEGGPANTVGSATAGSATRGPSISPEQDAEQVAADAAGVYWTVPSMGEVRGSIGGAAPITLVANEGELRALAADGTYVYWQTPGNELRRAGHVNNGTSSLFASGFVAVTEPKVRGIAVTSEYVVWLTGDGKVLRLHK